MSIADLKTRLHDVPGIETLTMQMLAGRQNYSLNGRLISVDAAASDNDVETAIRAAIASPAIAQMPAGTPIIPAPSIALAPAANIQTTAPAPQRPFQRPDIRRQALIPSRKCFKSTPAGWRSYRQPR